jgi:hypothetical protein
MSHFAVVSRSTVAVSLTLLAAAVGQGLAGPATAAEPRSSSLSAAAVNRPLPGPGHFVRTVDNPRLPWLPGTRWYYRSNGSDGRQRIIVRVLHRTTTIEGITATVVRDVVRSRGRAVEKTLDWYAQDKRGNVWYLGEATRTFEHGHVSTEGSWRAGVHGARAGIAMLAHPRVGAHYRQEFWAGHAEDRASVLATSLQVGVPIGHFRHVLLTDETTALEPRGDEVKFYVRGLGDVLEMDLSPHQGRTVLVRMVTP